MKVASVGFGISAVVSPVSYTRHKTLTIPRPARFTLRHASKRDTYSMTAPQEDFDGMNTIDRIHLTNRLSEFTAIAMISIAVVAPAIVVSASLPYFKIEQILIPVIFFVYLWLLLSGVARTIRLNALFVVGFLYCLCNVISIWYGAAALGHQVVGRDFYELPKVWLPVAFFTIGYECRLSEQSYRRLIAAFAIPALLVCLYAWSQFANLGFTHSL